MIYDKQALHEASKSNNIVTMRSVDMHWTHDSHLGTFINCSVYWTDHVCNAVGKAIE